MFRWTLFSIFIFLAGCGSGNGSSGGAVTSFAYSMNAMSSGQILVTQTSVTGGVTDGSSVSFTLAPNETKFSYTSSSWVDDDATPCCATEPVTQGSCAIPQELQIEINSFWNEAQICASTYIGLSNQFCEVSGPVENESVQSQTSQIVNFIGPNTGTVTLLPEPIASTGCNVNFFFCSSGDEAQLESIIQALQVIQSSGSCTISH